MAKKNDIAKVETASIQPVEQIESLIITVRGKQVILDRDLARLYGVETKRLNQQVQRNIERFPEDFMFQLTKEEAESSRSQFATLNDEIPNLKSQFATSSEEEILKSQFATSSWGGIRKLPYAFTENGIAMLSSVLRSPMAIATNIHIMRAFNAMRHFIGSHAQVFQRLEIVERNQLALNAHQEELSAQVAENNKKLEEVFKRLDAGDAKPEHGIFFDGQIFDSYIFINDRIREAKKRIILIDNYIDDSVLKMLDKREKGVAVKLYTNLSFGSLKMDLKKHNAQYAPIDAEQFNRSHDRFLCIDDTVYLVGASLKDLGKKWFGFSKMGVTTDELLSKM
ncbi:MAG: ORF6N domain-containing protein [Paludibacteraceae bacterium]|nr:ORF6N domain-containing protein [Paludibacteraceae bacterium]MBQ3999318.1 ORF6N domain-containing protein [Paludibacteraceae bacterium]